MVKIAWLGNYSFSTLAGITEHCGSLPLQNALEEKKQLAVAGLEPEPTACQATAPLPLGPRHLALTSRILVLVTFFL